MGKVIPSKQPCRPHHIPEWVETLDLTQAEFAEEIGADKGLVSRWYSGTSPGRGWQKKLAEFFNCEPESLFRHPDDDWIARFLRGRDKPEIERIKTVLESAFPKKS
jgi:transcriptional regulator with XRE-family HTH domain